MYFDVIAKEIEDANEIPYPSFPRKTHQVAEIVVGRGSLSTLALYQTCKWKFKMTVAQVNAALDDLADAGAVQLLATERAIIVMARITQRRSA